MRALLVVLVGVLASSVLAANLVQNPGFETRPGEKGSPWQMRKGQQADWVERADGAGHCVRLRAAAGETPLWSQQNLPLVGGKQYMVQYSVNAKAGTKYRVYIEWWTKEGKYGRCTGAAWRTANGGWEKVRFPFTFPEEMKPPYLVLQLQGPGEMRYDDVVVEEAVPEPTKEGCVFSASFETGAPTWEFVGNCQVAHEAARDGKACLVLAGKEKGDDSAAIRRGISTQKGHRYRLTYAVRAAGGSSETTGYQYFRVYTSWDRLVKDGRDYGAVVQHDGMAWQDCFGSWQKRTLEFETPQKPAGNLFLTLQVRGPGRVSFDALELRDIGPAVPPPPFELVLTQPPYRGTFFPGDPDEAVKGTIGTTRAGAARVRLRLGRGQAEVRLNGKAGEKAEFRIPAVAGQLVAESFDDKGKSLGSRTMKILQAKPPTAGRRVVIRADGILLVDGKTPCFPIGLWNAPGSERALAELADAGVVAIRCAGTEEMVGKLGRLGLMAIPSLPNRPPAEAAARAAWDKKAEELVRTLGAAPNVLAYYLVDEPLWSGTPLEPLIAAYQFYRQTDPWHPVWLNAAPRGTVEDLARYNQACDVSGVDIYPVPEGGSHSEMEDRTVSSVGKYTVKMLESTDYQKPVWMTLQGFAWTQLRNRQAPDAVFPTPHQSRFMAYDAVANGAGGIMYWGTHYIASPEYWDVLLGTVRDLSSVSGVLAGEPLAKEQFKVTGEGLAWCGKRTAAGDEYLIMVNESPQPVSVTVRTPWQGRELQSLVGGAQIPANHRTLPLRRGRFQDEFGPYDVRLYTTGKAWPKASPLVLAEPRTGELEGRSLREQARYLGETEAYKGKANWIWFPGTSGVAESTCVLRRSFSLAAVPREAWLVATADDELCLRVNGHEVVRSDGWSEAHRLSVVALLRHGRNLITVEAKDSGKPPAGFLCDLRLVMPDGKEQIILSDAAWRVAENGTAGWERPDYDDSSWQPAEIVAPYGNGPWGSRLLLSPEH